MLLKEFLEPRALSQADVARRLHVPLNRLNELILGKRGVTPDTALRLGALTGLDARVWMGLQADYDLWHAVKDVDLSRITPLKKSA
jgi:antitoxin HigA-1